MTSWREAGTPEGWPDWRLELEGERLEAGFNVSSSALPDAIGLDDGALAEVTLKRAVHVPTGSSIELRWQVDAYVETWMVGARDVDPVARYGAARLVIAGEPPPKRGRPAGRDVSGDQVLRAIIVFRRRYGRLPTQRQLVDPRFGRLVPTKAYDVKPVERAVGQSWKALLATADQLDAADLDLDGKGRPTE